MMERMTEVTPPTAPPTATAAAVRLPLAITFAAVLSALSLAWIAAETQYGKCVDAAAARYPAISVSAFTTEETGPLKVAYDVERRKAVDSCKRFVFV